MHTRIVAAVSLALVTLLATVVVQSAENAKKTGKGKITVKQQMKIAFRGTKKKPSPMARVMSDVERDKPDWKALRTHIAPLIQMVKIIKNSPTTGSKRGLRPQHTKSFVSSTDALVAAVKAEDIAKARTAVSGMLTSCVQCHRYGGPGGRSFSLFGDAKKTRMSLEKILGRGK